MSAARHQNHMRMQAALAEGRLGKPKGGLVTDYDPDAFAVKVLLQPEQIETGWLPIATIMAGNGFGVFCGPVNGAQAMVSFLEGDKEVGWCTGFVASDIDVPPKVLAGEVFVVAKAGQFAKFLADGTISLQATAGIVSKGPWTHTGTLHVTDEVTADKSVTATVDVVGGGKHLKTHVHSGVAAGGANTGQPV